VGAAFENLKHADLVCIYRITKLPAYCFLLVNDTFLFGHGPIKRGCAVNSTYRLVMMKYDSALAANIFNIRNRR
jgi:hypothetical protein